MTSPILTDKRHELVIDVPQGLVADNHDALVMLLDAFKQAEIEAVGAETAPSGAWIRLIAVTGYGARTGQGRSAIPTSSRRWRGSFRRRGRRIRSRSG